MNTIIKSNLDLWLCDLTFNRVYLLFKQNLSEASKQGIKYIKWITHWAQNFDLGLWTCDLKINKDHLLIEGNPCTKFGIVKWYWVDNTWSTDRPTYRPNNMPPFSRGGGGKKAERLGLPVIRNYAIRCEAALCLVWNFWYPLLCLSPLHVSNRLYHQKQVDLLINWSFTPCWQNFSHLMAVI